MTVLLDKRLTERQQWALEYLAALPGHKSRTSIHEYWDDGLEFLRAYAERFGLNRQDAPIDLRRSLKRVLDGLCDVGLVERSDGSNHGVVGSRDHGPSHNNEYWITNRGKRAAVSHDTYD